MAKLASNIDLILTILCLLVSILGAYATKQGSHVAKEETNLHGHARLGKAKLAKLHFYVHDLSVNHPNTTTYDVAQASITATSKIGFGRVRVVDDLVTAEADANSRPLGRVQGIVAKSDLTTLGIGMYVNIYFTAGKFAGSTLSILGRNEMNNRRRELVVAGGTGFFRFASGYANQSTDSYGADVAVLEYYVYTTYSPKLIELDDVEVTEM